MPAREVQLGGSTLTRVGLGTNRLSDSGPNHEFLRSAVAAGIEMIDTAHLYSGGESERSIGNALAPFDDRLAVATKAGYRPGSGHPERLRAEIEESFVRLRSETIRLYYLHRVDPGVELEESLGVLAEYREAGRIGNVGISDVTIEQIERARAVVEIAAVQNEYNLAERSDDPVVDHCEREGIVFVPFYPLHGAGAAAEIAHTRGATAAQVTLAWLLHRSPAMLPIPGTLSIEHVRENLVALDLELSEEEIAVLDRAA